VAAGAGPLHAVPGGEQARGFLDVGAPPRGQMSLLVGDLGAGQFADL